MRVFASEKFSQGSWVSGLGRLLRERPILSNKYVVTRHWTPTQSHWIQFEPAKNFGPAFWLGKPAIVAGDTSLYVGYYVERGYPSHQNRDYVLDDHWHWHFFVSTLADDATRQRLNQLMETLPKERRCIRLICNQQPFDDIPYENLSSLNAMESAINQCDPQAWIDLVLGVSFGLNECLNLQDQVVDQLRSPLMRARDIEALLMEKQTA